jgi:hypothetical protein
MKEDTGLARRLRLKTAFHDKKMSDALFVVYCEENNIISHDWRVQWDGRLEYSQEWDEDIAGEMHLLYDAVSKGEKGLFRIPEKVRTAFTLRDFNERPVWAASECAGPSAWQILCQTIRGDRLLVFIQAIFPQVYEQKCVEGVEKAMFDFKRAKEDHEHSDAYFRRATANLLEAKKCLEHYRGPR